MSPATTRPTGDRERFLEDLHSDRGGGRRDFSCHPLGRDCRWGRCMKSTWLLLSASILLLAGAGLLLVAGPEFGRLLHRIEHHRLIALGFLGGCVVFLLLRRHGRFLERLGRRHRLCLGWLPQAGHSLHDALWSCSIGVAIAGFGHNPTVVVLEFVVATVKLMLHTPLGWAVVLLVPLCKHCWRKCLRWWRRMIF